ncbi:hypothetical protein OVA10_22550 [Lelliottia sp. SL45]|uniref:hypothetical protein n=1 Tax=Lelliottia sp. SL45 TaxID=2994665 RepID=UPI0022758DF6|nr:hypothetical protein [Lelliottia sp. SL45]MCY1700813.1 hypothetical protein [Lelliottia sp. SL45]
MLHAILNGKARRVSLLNDESHSWRSVFKRYEDLLTAAFWGRMSYLSHEAQHKILSSLLALDSRVWGTLDTIQFWPRYALPDEFDESLYAQITGEENFAEPDVVLTFKFAIIIIEVKPPAGGMQYQKQWFREIYAWKNTDENANGKKLHFLALGNLPENYEILSKQLENHFGDVKCHCIEWDQVRMVLQHPEWEWPTKADKRISEDCLQALALYGIREPLGPWKPFLNFLSSQNLPEDFSFLQGKQ